MNFFEKLGSFISPEKREDNEKMERNLDQAKKIIEEESYRRGMEIVKDSAGQIETEEASRRILEREGNAELDNLINYLKEILDKDSDVHKKVIEALEKDYNWTENMSEERLLVILDAFEELKEKSFDLPDENEIHNSPGGESVTRDTRLKVRDIVERDKPTLVDGDLDRLIDIIIDNRMFKSVNK